MSEVKRYNANVFFPGCLGPASREVVLADDAEKLEAEAQALREEVARSEQHRNDQADLIVSLRTEVAALRARVVVDEDGAFDEWWDGSGFYKFRETAMAAWEARARLNGKAVSEELLRRLSIHKPGYDADHYEAVEELRDLLDGWKEAGDVLVHE